MISSSASRVLLRRGYRGAMVAARSRIATTRPLRPVPISITQQQQLQQQPIVFTMRHFSSPPAFLDPGEVQDRILNVVKNFDQVDPNKVTPETKFADDLGLDSLDIVEVVMAIEDEFAIEIPDQEADKISSIADAIEYISSHPMAK